MPPLTLSTSGRRYGYLADRPDWRDFGARHIPAGVVGAETAPSSVDMEPSCGPVRDQGDEGSCTAHAGVGMREFLARRYQQQSPILSPAFLYYQERLLDGTLDEGDCGSYGRTACQAMNKFGVCTLGDEAYVPGDFATAPTDAQLADAMTWKSGAYHRLATVADMKSCLASGYVFAIGFTVYQSFEALSATVPVYKPAKSDEQVLGGHEVLVIGYDDSRFDGSFKVRNSWGPSWADNGNFWIPYPVAADGDVLIDAWMQHLGKAW